MAIDLKALRQMSEGDPRAKVAVSKAWLREVYRLLSLAECDRGMNNLGDKLSDLVRTMRGGPDS